MEYVPRLNWDDNATNEERLRAMYNFLNWLLFEMAEGRVKTNKEELQNNLERANVPLSIAFVTLAEKGEIDEITASEHMEMFLPWGENISFNTGDLRTFPVKKLETMGGEEVEFEHLTLFKCLQAHTSQAGWTPTTSPSLWKAIEVNVWSQPISLADSYMKGDETTYNGKKVRSLIDYNVWSPDDYPEGWEVVVE